MITTTKVQEDYFFERLRYMLLQVILERDANGDVKTFKVKE